ncbi:MAG: MBL fold metallo-hydrolase [Deltaproteobacteria bacterium]|nr:MBL fold metallo-hydrolase [Deltaproteobacteria bacterium]
MSQFEIIQKEIGPMENFVYLIGDKQTKKAAIVDPGWDAEAISKMAHDAGYSITDILVSHTHFDHVNALGDLLKKLDATVHVHKSEAPYLKSAQGNIKPSESGDVLELGSTKIRFIHTPGHTPGSQCFHVDDNLISGDTLFINGCGRCDLPGGNPEEMYESLHNKLMKLKDTTTLYPGHNYAATKTSTISKEKENNPFMLKESLEDFLRLRMGL